VIRIRKPDKNRGEKCQWHFARKSSDGNWFANREVSGSRNVTRIPHPQPRKIHLCCRWFFCGFDARKPTAWLAWDSNGRSDVEPLGETASRAQQQNAKHFDWWVEIPHPQPLKSTYLLMGRFLKLKSGLERPTKKLILYFDYEIS
jgi:hypothetical protein